MCCDDHPATTSAPIMLNPPTPEFPYATFRMTGAKLLALLAEFGTGWGYGLGFKVEPLDLQGPELVGTNGQTGIWARKVDCSGLVRWALHHAAAADVPDGSANQHEWAKAHGFKPTTPEACALHDGVVRWCFLTPEQGGGIGHVLFVFGGMTIESFGGHGPGSRPFDPSVHPWMGELDCYVATRPA